MAAKSFNDEVAKAVARLIEEAKKNSHAYTVVPGDVISKNLADFAAGKLISPTEKIEVAGVRLATLRR
jgi:hypothetical protein